MRMKNIISEQKQVTFFVILSVFILSFFISNIAFPWETVATGIEYQKFTLPDPNNVFVVRASRTQSNLLIDSMISMGKIRTGLETVKNMANRYENTVNYSGELYDVVAGINGDFFSYSTNYPVQGQIICGNFVDRYVDYAGQAIFCWKRDGTVFVDWDIVNTGFNREYVVVNGTQYELSNLNVSRGTNQLILYTPQYDDRTYTDNSGTELIVRVDNMPLYVEQDTTGIIIEKRVNQGSSFIPFDCVVISGQGTMATPLNNANVGDSVLIRLRVKSYGDTYVGGTQLPRDWENAYASIGCNLWCVKEGIVPSEDWDDKPGAIIRDPRTAAAFNEDYIYFVVVDGRSGISAGMTITELGNFCLNELQADHALSLDGGGSSTLVVNGVVKNQPSDGYERAVSNGLMMVLATQSAKSIGFNVGTRVRAIMSVNLYLGPGTNYGVVATAPQGQEGEIVDNSLNGIYANGNYWWKWKYGTTEGWSSATYFLVLSRIVNWENYE